MASLVSFRFGNYLICVPMLKSRCNATRVAGGQKNNTFCTTCVENYLESHSCFLWT